MWKRSTKNMQKKIILSTPELIFNSDEKWFMTVLLLFKIFSILASLSILISLYTLPILANLKRTLVLSVVSSACEPAKRKTSTGMIETTSIKNHFLKYIFAMLFLSVISLKSYSSVTEVKNVRIMSIKKNPSIIQNATSHPSSLASESLKANLQGTTKLMNKRRTSM